MRVEVNGIGLNVEVSGTGRPLLLLHGFTGSSRSWERFLPAWNEGCQTIAVDIIGHGLSDAPEDPARYTMDWAVRDLTALLDFLDIGEASVLGYSMGGRLALSMAMLAPGRVSALLLESSSPGLQTQAEREARIGQDEALAARIVSEGIERFVAYWEHIPLFQGIQQLPAGVRMEIRNQRLQNHEAGLANSLRGMGTGAQPSWWGCLKELQMPVLLMAGERDEKFCGIAQDMKSAIPDSKLVLVEGAGHTIHVEQAEKFGTIIKEYLDERMNR